MTNHIDSPPSLRDLAAQGRILSVEETAAALNMSPRSVREMCRTQKIAGLLPRMGRGPYRISAEHLYDWVAKNALAA